MDMKFFAKECRIYHLVLFYTISLLFNQNIVSAQPLLSENIKFAGNVTMHNSNKFDEILLNKETKIKELKSILNEKIKRIKFVESQIELLRKNKEKKSRKFPRIATANLKITNPILKPRRKEVALNPLKINSVKNNYQKELEEKENKISELKKALEERKERINRITRRIAELRYGVVLDIGASKNVTIIKEKEISFRHKERPGKRDLLKGQILDIETGLPLKNAMVILNGTERGCLTDSLGIFEFTNLKSGLYNINAKMIGYSDEHLENVPVFNGVHKNHILKLKRKPIGLQPVTVFAYKENDPTLNEVNDGLNQILASKYIEKVPGSFNDIFRSFAISPSVSQTNDINGLLYVRGGSSDQNLVLMDGFEVYYPYRMRIAMGGGVSAFDAEIVESIELIPGGFSAKYGNHLSSVLKVKMNGTNYQKKSLRFNLNLLTFSSALQLPLHGNKGSFILSTRGSVFGAIANRLLQSNYVLPSFNDFFSKISYNISPNNKIMLNVLHASEGTKGTTIVSEQMNVINQTQNDNIGLHWQFVVNPKTILSTNVSYYLDNNLLKFKDTNTSRYQADLKYNIKKINLKSDLQHYFNPSMKMDFGTNVEQSDYLLNWLLNWRSKIDVPLNIDFKSNSVIVGNYLQFRFLLSKKLRIKMGVREDYSTLNKQHLFSPRFNFSYLYKPGLRLFGAYGDYYQYPNLLSSITRGEPLDISPNISSLKAEKSTHYIIGSEINLTKSYKFKISGYYKNYDQLLTPKDYISFIATNLGRGFSKGLEISLGNELTFNKFVHWQLNYAYAKSRYRSRINSSMLPFKWDQPHSLNALFNFSISSNCYIGFRWNYNSGLPAYFKTGQVTDNGNIGFNRYPAYSRLDLKFGYSFGSKIRYLFYMDMINLTNKKNVYANNWDFHDSQVTAQNKQTPIYTMPFLLSVGLKIEL